MKFRRWASAVFVLTYMLALFAGIAGHALKIGFAGTTLGYFFVWDMFCGWQAYDSRTRVIGEDAHGNYYAIEEPWGAHTPCGNVARINHDVNNNLLPRHIHNVLNHSSHPPIDRVYVVQEIWPKQFNVPDHLWGCCFNEPRDEMRYYNLRAICNDRGVSLEVYPDWFDEQSTQAIANNPRLQQAAQLSTPYDNTFFSPSSSRLSKFPEASDGLSTN